jgi:hypothetical protein
VRLLLTLGILVRSFLGLSDSKKAETFCVAEPASQEPLGDFGGLFSKKLYFWFACSVGWIACWSFMACHCKRPEGTYFSCGPISLFFVVRPCPMDGFRSVFLIISAGIYCSPLSAHNCLRLPVLLSSRVMSSGYQDACWAALQNGYR